MFLSVFLLWDEEERRNFLDFFFLSRVAEDKVEKKMSRKKLGMCVCVANSSHQHYKRVLL